jgi:hypothetical protein
MIRSDYQVFGKKPLPPCPSKTSNLQLLREETKVFREFLRLCVPDYTRPAEFNLFFISS